MKTQKIKFVTGSVRFDNVNLNPKESSLNEDINFKYKLSIVIEKTNLKEIEQIQKVVEELTKDTSTKKNIGLYKGNDPDCLYLNVVSNERPGIVDIDLNPISDVSEIYNGCIGRVSVTAFTYEYSGQLGVTFGLNSIQKLDDR